MKRRRRVIRRSSKVISQATIDKRMREVWIDGFGLLPNSATEMDLERFRESMRKLVEDDEYWEGLEELAILKKNVVELMSTLKGDKQK